MQNIEGKLFKNKYRIESNRLRGWDYSSNGSYFITICTQNRKNYFGEITEFEPDVETRFIASPRTKPQIGNAILQKNELGKIAEKYWLEIPIHFLFTYLDAFIIMPNHVHGILIIKNDQAMVKEHKNNPGGVTKQKNPMLYQSISRIIRWYKGRCTFEINKTQSFRWQSGFYDHFIADENDLHRIQEYVRKNPSNWLTDELFTK